MTEIEKLKSQMYYNTNSDEVRCCTEKMKDLCFEYNHTRPSDLKRREVLIRQLFGKVGKDPYVEPTIFCGFGWNIEVGDHFFANNNCVFVDPGKITFGDYVFIGPQCGFYTAHHPIHPEPRNQLLEYAYPITVGSHVWMGGGTVVCPGVTIGSNVVIGAGSVVCKDIPDNCVAVGNPCVPIRPITEDDLKNIT